jgi:hypothetical protein
VSEDLGEEDIVGLVLGFELVANRRRRRRFASVLVSRVGRSREPKAAETYLGSCGAVVVLTALVEGKLFNDRSRSRVWIIFLGSARTGMR